MPLRNRHILLGVTGGIAAYKALELVRLLKKEGAQVRVVMTKAACEFIAPLSFQALSGHSVHIELLDVDAENAMGHIELARWADIFIIAPASANTMSKLAHGNADDLLSTLYLAANCPVYIAPAMNHVMWHHVATQTNIQLLQTHGIRLISPEAGEQACGEMGVGRMAEPHTICARLLADIAAPSQILAGIHIMITAGATREPLDAVRYITNRSSGKMGYAIACAAQLAGANVTLISGITALSPPKNCRFIQTETAQAMHNAVFENINPCDIFIGAAAVADYRPIEVAQKKIKKKDDTLTLTFQKNADILADVAALKNSPFTVGFAAETHDLEHYARDKLVRKKLDMIAANWVGGERGGFESNDNALDIFWHDGQQSLPMTCKETLAMQLISLIATRFQLKTKPI
ncbi:MAG: bifunctional phosphopantothenoylcysteine decarboxylase/phosphopantothenate--cysteine ligase CoaBC [Methylococcales bacterium]|nr:bifunctional phosphopantothenoylcysteine decarboxylase/phosphopantothenate--cysteine ligase CoaBC [Methylococcales bacterium]